MKIQWFAQSSFLIISRDGLRLITDPYDPAIGYKEIAEKADIVTISHEHRDHNHLASVRGDFRLLNGPGEYEVRGRRLRGIPSFHDDSGGQLRGKNTIFCFELDGIAICHLGDLGYVPDQELLGAIGRVDVLFIPVGGQYTIDARQAADTVKLIKPRIVIPMHYRTEAGGVNLSPLSDFIATQSSILSSSRPQFELTVKTLPAKTQVIPLVRTR